MRVEEQEGVTMLETNDALRRYVLSFQMCAKTLQEVLVSLSDTAKVEARTHFLGFAAGATR